MSAGVGLTVTARLDEAGTLVLGLIGDLGGRLSADEFEAKRLVFGAPERCTREMRAALLEQLAALVPVRCSDCGVETDVAALVRALREGTELS